MLTDLKYTFWEDSCYELGDISDMMKRLHHAGPINYAGLPA